MSSAAAAAVASSDDSLANYHLGDRIERVAEDDYETGTLMYFFRRNKKGSSLKRCLKSIQALSIKIQNDDEEYLKSLTDAKLSKYMDRVFMLMFSNFFYYLVDEKSVTTDKLQSYCFHILNVYIWLYQNHPNHRDLLIPFVDAKNVKLSTPLQAQCARAAVLMKNRYQQPTTAINTVHRLPVDEFVHRLCLICSSAQEYTISKTIDTKTAGIIFEGDNEFNTLKTDKDPLAVYYTTTLKTFKVHCAAEIKRLRQLQKKLGKKQEDDKADTVSSTDEEEEAEKTSKSAASKKQPRHKKSHSDDGSGGGGGVVGVLTRFKNLFSSAASSSSSSSVRTPTEDELARASNDLTCDDTAAEFLTCLRKIKAMAKSIDHSTPGPPSTIADAPSVITAIRRILFAHSFFLDLIANTHKSADENLTLEVVCADILEVYQVILRYCGYCTLMPGAPKIKADYTVQDNYDFVIKICKEYATNTIPAVRTGIQTPPGKDLKECAIILCYVADRGADGFQSTTADVAFHIRNSKINALQGTDYATYEWIRENRDELVERAQERRKAVEKPTMKPAPPPSVTHPVDPLSVYAQFVVVHHYVHKMVQ